MVCGGEYHENSELYNQRYHTQIHEVFQKIVHHQTLIVKYIEFSENVKNAMMIVDVEQRKDSLKKLSIILLLGKSLKTSKSFNVLFEKKKLVCLLTKP